MGIKVAILEKDGTEYDFPVEYQINGVDVPYNNTETGLPATNLQEAVDEIFNGNIIRTFTHAIHYVSGTGLNTTMTNGSFFRAFPGTSSTGSYSGYPACFPLNIPYKCELQSIILVFRSASFDWSAVVGPILMEIEVRDHQYNGSTIFNRILLRFGNYQYSSTGTGTHKFELFLVDDSSQGFSYVSGIQEFTYASMLGFRFVKAQSGDRRINSIVDARITLNFEEKK